MNRMRPSPFRLGCVLLVLSTGAAGAAVAPPVVVFDRDIAPLLAKRCLDCHAGSTPEGGLDLGRRASALKAIVPGKRGVSRLWKRVLADEMPPNKPLPDDEKQLLRAWL